MSKGFDTTNDCAPLAARIKTGGYTFVARYYSHSIWKNLTRSEAGALSAAGLYIVAVWESAGDHPSFFSHDQGRHDGQTAFAFAQAIGQPLPSPIYFAVDADLPGAGGVQAYFEGVREAFGAHGAIGSTAYSVGVYGSGNVCAHLSGLVYVSHTWLAQSMGWGGSRAYSDWNIKQGRSQNVLGLSVDTDIAAASGGGGWQL